MEVWNNTRNQKTDPSTSTEHHRHLLEKANNKQLPSAQKEGQNNTQNNMSRKIKYFWHYY